MSEELGAVALRGKSGLSDEATGRWFMFRYKPPVGWTSSRTLRVVTQHWCCLKEKRIDRDREADSPYNDSAGRV
jgi:hypothetical protein